MKKKGNDVLIIQKYKKSKIGIITMIITLVIALVCYAIILYLNQKRNISGSCAVVLNICRDMLLAVISIVGTSLLTSVFIELNRRNVDYTELIANDIFASAEFYSNLTDENKEKMSRYLEENMYHRDPVRSEIYQSCKEYIYSNKMVYYYEDFNMSIDYFNRIEYSEKNIKRTMKLRSYESKIKSDKLYLFTYNLSPVDKVKNFEVLSAWIGENNDKLEIGKDIVIEKKETRTPLWEKCGYTETYDVYLNKCITLYADRDVVLYIEYVSRVSNEDMSVGFGVPVPCKKAYYNFTAPHNYVVYAHPYSFMNIDNNYPNTLYRNSISVHFDNWLLPGEGVAICVAETVINDISINA